MAIRKPSKASFLIERFKIFLKLNKIPKFETNSSVFDFDQNFAVLPIYLGTIKIYTQSDWLNFVMDILETEF